MKTHTQIEFEHFENRLLKEAIRPWRILFELPEKARHCGSETFLSRAPGVTLELCEKVAHTIANNELCSLAKLEQIERVLKALREVCHEQSKSSFWRQFSTDESEQTKMLVETLSSTREYQFVRCNDALNLIQRTRTFVNVSPERSLS